ncbi:hypothetical protein GCM10017788_56850 [Amycolatopsis acidiphila]|uniref:Nucleoside diphosphate kinase regulator n=1 Tax=Amycolatopsis acidiphila TaxID=715473 RepID=A0A558ACE6_9PSEU|nr:nucleoside diphosphate kinase regulator [Amycolatopsis acidiphila]GHG84614.1 hypothetical protein GCM10017788_56850 [Amycolatopsis acidiphila]
MTPRSDKTAGLSDGTRARLEQELRTLRDRRDELTADARALDTTGDRGDNADPLREDDEIARVEDRIAELSRLLAAGPGAGSAGGAEAGVPDGTTATLRFGDGTEQALQVVAITEEIPPGREDTTITTDSPLGLALAGHQAGDTISYSTPAGEAQAYLVSIEFPGGERAGRR